MAIKWYNIRSREVRIAETEPQISAMWSSSDHSPNITQGQDFGWRLAPEVVVEMKQIKQDRQLLQQIASMYSKLAEDVKEPDILMYISDRTDAENAPMATEGDYTDEYDQEVRRLELERKEKAAQALNPPATTVTTTESLADMERRAELEERIAKAKQAQANIGAKPGMQEAHETTTTTTVPPTTTTTTTKK